MANPQKENGFTGTANELIEAICKLHISGRAHCVLRYIERKTYGYGKKVDAISLTQLERGTGINRAGVILAIKQLIENNVIVVIRGGYITSYGINKNYELWGSIRIDTSIKTDTTTSIRTDTKTSIKTDTHKRKKERKKLPAKAGKHMGGFNLTGDDYLEGEIDYDGDGTVRNKELELKKENAERNAKFRTAIDWLIKHQGRDPIRTPVPKQLKAIQKLFTMGVSANEAKQIIMECEGQDQWRGKKEKPDFWTVVSIIQKRG